MSESVPYVSLTVDAFNPNHRLRFLGLADPTRYLFDLATAVGDDSFYLAPKFERPTTVSDQNNRLPTGGIEVPPDGDFHVSFHQSGAVNLHLLGSRRLLRPAGAGRGQSGLAARLVFNSTALFRSASSDEINSLPGRYTVIPVVGLRDSLPVCVDLYQAPRPQPWVMPRLADVFQLHAQVRPERKDSDYHFIVWQHTRAKRPKGDLAIYYAPESPKL